MSQIRHTLIDGNVTHIDDYQNHQIPLCPGCSGQLIAKKGKQKKWHYAHKNTAKCSSESGLHKTCKLMISSTFNSKKAASQRYSMIWKCPSCEYVGQADVAKLSDRAHTEKKLEFGTVPDLFFVNKEGRSFAIEVIAPHEMEEKTKKANSINNTPVFYVRPSWESITSYEYGIIATDSFNLNREKCKGCKERKNLVAIGVRWKPVPRKSIHFLKVAWDHFKFSTPSTVGTLMEPVRREKLCRFYQ